MIVCDDKGSVGIINPVNMQKIASVPLPNENCYLYSVYKDEASKTLFLAFDNKLMIGFDSERYTKKSSMTLEIACMKFS